MKKIEIFPKRYGVLPYVFLIYMFFPLLYFRHMTGLKVVIGYSLLLLFLISYRQLYSDLVVKHFNYWLVVQMGIVIVFSLFYDPYLLFMGFFPANFVGWYEDKKRFKYAILSFSFAIIITTFILTLQNSFLEMLFFFPFLLVMIGSTFGIRSMNEKLQLELLLDQANDQIKDFIQREERIRIARDLHDTLGHTLSLITLQSQLVQRIAEKQPQRVKLEAKEIEMTARAALRQVRELVSDMRTITIIGELADMEQILDVAGIQFQLNDHSDLPELSPIQHNILGMCLRETATNIVKHSKAKSCIVTFKNDRRDFTISIEDNGIGMADNEIAGNGLIGMRERMALIDGTFTIESKVGTTVMLTVPVILKQKESVAF